MGDIEVSGCRYKGFVVERSERGARADGAAGSSTTGFALRSG